MFHSRTTTATDNAGTGSDEEFCVPGKFFWRRAIDGLAVFYFRQPCVWLSNDRHGGIFIHGFNCLHHVGRTGRAVHANRVGTHFLQDHDGHFRRRAVKGVPVGFKGQRYHNRQIARFANRQESRPRFLQAHHRFYDKDIDTGFP